MMGSLKFDALYDIMLSEVQDNVQQEQVINIHFPAARLGITVYRTFISHQCGPSCCYLNSYGCSDRSGEHSGAFSS